MGRPPSANPKHHVIAVRLSEAELAYVDSVRGPMKRSQWIRWILLRNKKEK